MANNARFHPQRSGTGGWRCKSGAGAGELSGYRIERAVAADAGHLPVVELLGGEAFLDVPGLEWIADDDVMSAEEQRPLVEAGTVWVARDGDEIAGFLSVEEIGDDLHVRNVSVLPDCQKQGIGRALFAEAIAQANARGVERLTLTTFRDLAFNELFYASMGFVRLEEAELPKRLRDELDDEAARGLPCERRCAMVLELGITPPLLP